MVQVELACGEELVTLNDLAPREQETALATQENLFKSNHPHSKSGHFVSGGVLVEFPEGTYEIFLAANDEIAPTIFSCAEQGVTRETRNHLEKEQLSYISSVFVIDQNGDETPTEKPPWPCAVCRGWLAGLAKDAGLYEDMIVYVFNTTLEVGVKSTIGILLPHMRDIP